MDDQVLQEMLLEIRGLRDDVSGWRRETAERLMRLETVVDPALVWVPSRMSLLETRVLSLERSWWKLTGAGVVIWALITFGFEVLKTKFVH